MLGLSWSLECLGSSSISSVVQKFTTHCFPRPRMSDAFATHDELLWLFTTYGGTTEIRLKGACDEEIPRPAVGRQSTRTTNALRKSAHGSGTGWLCRADGPDGNDSAFFAPPL